MTAMPRIERILIPTSEGSLQAELVVPGQSGAYPVILVAHSSAGIEEETYAWGRTFGEHGFAALTVVRRDYPLEGGRPPIKMRWGARALADWTNVLARLREIPQVNTDRIGWFGFSEGASLGYRLAAHFPQLRAVAGWGGVADPADFFRWVVERWSRFPHDWMREYAQFVEQRYAGPHAGAVALAARDLPPGFEERIQASLLLLHGEEDLWVPVRQTEAFARRLARLGKPHDVIIYPTEGHLLYVFTRPDAGWGRDPTSEWLRPQFVSAFTVESVKGELLRFFRRTLGG